MFFAYEFVKNETLNLDKLLNTFIREATVMQRRFKVVVLIIIIVVIVIGIGIFDFFNQNTVKVGESTFNIPEGYREGNLNEVGAVNLTNGYSSIFLSEYNTTDVESYVEGYVKNLEDQNISVDVVNYTVDDVMVYKSDNKNDSGNIHYWFVKNNKMYTVYTWDGSKEIESVVENFINSDSFFNIV